MHALFDIFRGIAKCNIRIGTLAHFWGDLWEGEIKSVKYQNMFSLALNKDETVKSLCSKFLEDSFLLSLRLCLRRGDRGDWEDTQNKVSH